MGRFSNFTENQKKIEAALKAFYKKHGIELDKEKGKDKENDPILEGFYTFNRGMATLFPKEDPTKEQLERFITNIANEQYTFALDYCIKKKKNEALDGPEPLLYYNEKDTNAEFMSDFKSLFEDIFSLIYKDHLSENTKTRLKQEGRDHNFFNRQTRDAEFVKANYNAATDIEILKKAGNLYTNREMMEQLRDSINSYNNAGNSEKQTAQDNLMASYIALKNQYEKRNKFARIFNGIDSRKRFKEAEAIINNLVSQGKINAVMKDGKIDYYQTAMKHCKPSTYYEKMVNSVDNVKYNEYGEKEFANAKKAEIEKEKQNQAVENKKEDAKKYETYFKQIQNKQPINYVNMTANDYKIYEKAVNSYNTVLENDKKIIFGKQIPEIKALYIQAINDHYDAKMNDNKITDKTGIEFDRTEALEFAQEQKHRSKLLAKIKDLKDAGFIDKVKYDLSKFEQDPKAVELENKKFKLVSYEEVQELQKEAEKNKDEFNMIANGEEDKRIQIILNIDENEKQNEDNHKRIEEINRRMELDESIASDDDGPIEETDELNTSL